MILTSNFSGEPVIIIVRYGQKGDTGDITPELQQLHNVTSQRALEAEQNAALTLDRLTSATAQADRSELWAKQAEKGWFDHGPYNPQENEPALGEDADDWKEGDLLGRFTITVGGVLPFSGSNFTEGTAVQNYDELRGGEDGLWYLVPGPFKPSDDISVQNYADAVPYFSGDAKRRIWVETDFEYNEGNESFYDYVPGKGVGFLGLDFNYTEQ